jgi:hypothetical protein
MFSYAGAIIVLIVCGYQVQNKEDSMISLAESAMSQFKLLRNPVVYLVDYIPLCMPISTSMAIIPDDFASTVRYVPAWFPGAGFKKVASDVRRLVEENSNVPFQISVQEMVYEDCFYYSSRWC